MSEKRSLLRKGDIIKLGTGHRVYAMIPKHLVYSNKKGDWSLTSAEVNLSDDFYEYLRGEYIVVKTTKTPAGTGSGPNDIYPSGHLVTCQKLSEGHEVKFYQTGCFSCTIEDIKPIKLPIPLTHGERE